MQNTPIFSYPVIGDFTSLKAIEVKQTLFDLLEKGNTNLLLDFSNVGEVDVVGINTLAIVYKYLRSKNSNLTILLNKDSHLSKMLHLTKFENIFTLIYP